MLSLGMSRWRTLSVAAKIRGMIMLTTALALLASSSVLVGFEVLSSRSALVERISVLAEFVGTHVTAALSFDDEKTAQLMLQSMKAGHDVVMAQIYDEQGNLFASSNMGAPLSVTEQYEDGARDVRRGVLGHRFSLRSLHLVTAINLDNAQIGVLYVQASLDTLYRQIIGYLASVLTVWIAVLMAIYGLSARLHHRVSGPIGTLLQGMKAISAEQNFSLRIPVSDSDEIGAIIHGFNDMVCTLEERNAEIEQKSQEINKHAFFDALTGLPNRRFLMEHLGKELERTRRYGHSGALIFLDLDHFKTINDSLGHSTGDSLLVQVSNRLKGALRKTDIVSRVGGDEFIILLSGLSLNDATAAKNALMLVEGLRHHIAEPYEIEGRMLYTSASIGITLFNSGNHDVGDIIKQADLAMYRAKEDGRNLTQFFSADMQLHAEQRLRIEADMRFALDRDPHQFELYYQPQVNGAGHTFGAEVLLRWHHPLQGVIGPMTFIPIAEATGLINRLGQWILRQACQQLIAWQARGIDLQLAVNVSPSELLHPDFVDNVRDIVVASGIDPSRLELEITEGVFMRNIHETVTVMKKLRALGIQFAIDDFGTGYSSLQYLKALPLEKLKIDKSFVSDIESDPNDAAIVATIIAMGKSLGMKVIAEGVETDSEQQFLTRSGCDLFQGYLFGRPLRLTDFDARLDGERARCEHEQGGSRQAHSQRGG